MNNIKCICGWEPTYVGLNYIECQNPYCANFKYDYFIPMDEYEKMLDEYCRKNNLDYLYPFSKRKRRVLLEKFCNKHANYFVDKRWDIFQKFCEENDND